MLNLQGGRALRAGLVALVLGKRDRVAPLHQDCLVAVRFETNLTIGAPFSFCFTLKQIVQSKTKIRQQLGLSCMLYLIPCNSSDHLRIRAAFKKLEHIINISSAYLNSYELLRICCADIAQTLGIRFIPIY